MLIVSGWIRIAPGQRDRFLAASHEAMVRARRSPGCRAFVVAADPIEPDQVNVYEEWDSVAQLETFRGSGQGAEQSAVIVDATVARHNVASSRPA